MAQTFYWHDYETWGTSARFTQAVQFAGVRTDLDFNEVEEPLVIYNKPLPDLLPDPAAILVTGIAPQEAAEKGVPEPEFIKQIHNQLSRSNTIGVGYNSLRFDDEFTRFALYRNFYDPYRREWDSGNSRWDIIDLVRAARALRPEGIEWPKTDGVPSNKLEAMTQANGIEHEGAHDALIDVRATIALAKLIKTKQPDLYEFAFKLRDKKEVGLQLMDALAQPKPLVHVSGKFANEVCNTSAVAIVGRDQQIKNKFIAYDLRIDPDSFAELSVEQLRERVFTSREELGDQQRLPLKSIATNKAPFIAPMGVLDTKAQKRIQLDLATIQKHHHKLQAQPELIKKLQSVFTNNHETHPDVDTQLYDGFFSDDDRKTLQQLRSTLPQQWPSIASSDGRIVKLANRYRARHYPQMLSEDEQQRWEKHRAERLLSAYSGGFMTFDEYARQLEQLAQEHAGDDHKSFLLEELKLYGQAVYPIEVD